VAENRKHRHDLLAVENGQTEFGTPFRQAPEARQPTVHVPAVKIEVCMKVVGRCPREHRCRLLVIGGRACDFVQHHIPPRASADCHHSAARAIEFVLGGRLKLSLGKPRTLDRHQVVDSGFVVTTSIAGCDLDGDKELGVRELSLIGQSKPAAADHDRPVGTWFSQLCEAIREGCENRTAQGLMPACRRL
jgi:hypothetical protein